MASRVMGAGRSRWPDQERKPMSTLRFVVDVLAGNNFVSSEMRINESSGQSEEKE